MNIKEEIQKAREAHDAETSQVTKAYLHGFLCGLTWFESEIKRLRRAIEEHKKEKESWGIMHISDDKKLWDVLK
jgi:Pyruvate/2-oxoacid:ferredoxin oxidoreductase gamma subunit